MFDSLKGSQITKSHRIGYFVSRVAADPPENYVAPADDFAASVASADDDAAAPTADPWPTRLTRAPAVTRSPSDAAG